MDYPAMDAFARSVNLVPSYNVCRDRMAETRRSLPKQEDRGILSRIAAAILGDDDLLALNTELPELVQCVLDESVQVLYIYYHYTRSV